MDTKKYLLYRKSAAQAELAVIEKALNELEGGAESTEAAPATTPKTGKATAGKASGKTSTKAKQEEPAEELEETSEASGDDDMFGDDEAEESNEPTLEDVRKIVKDFATKHGKEKAMKLLGKFKVTAINDIKKADYAKVIELAKKHL